MSTLLSTTAAAAGTVTSAAQVVGYRHGVRALGMQVNFTGGAGGTSVDVTIQTSIDGGGTWIDIWHCTQFVNTPARRCAAFAFQSPTADVPVSGALGTPATTRALMGGHLRAVAVVVGSYTSTLVQVDVYTEQLSPA